MADLKVINGRVATEADVDARSVVFYIPNSRRVPNDFGRKLPLQARIVKAGDGDGFVVGTVVTVVQAEVVDGQDVLLGVMFGEAEEGILALEDVELLGVLAAPNQTASE